MTKIIHDLDHMRNEIEENKKKRQYRIENYRNISNLRKEESESKIRINESLPIESGIKKSKNSLKESQERNKNQHEMIMKRENHRFKGPVNE
jgi:hypothetical protein